MRGDMEKLDLFKVYMSPNVLKPMTEVLMSGYIGQGPKVEEFEYILKNHFNNDFVVTCNSCTSALHLALRIIKDKYGLNSENEVLSTCLSCFASVSPILANDLKIKWVDVDLNSCNIDLDDLERKLTPLTRVVMLVHWGGTPVDLSRLENIKKKYRDTFGKDLIVVEDCAHCWNSFYKEKMIGNSGNYCCFSFQAIKFLTTGDGGLLITPDAESYEKAKLLRWFGLDRARGQSFRCLQDISEWGYKFQPNDVMAVQGIYNFVGANENVEKHKDNASFYNEAFEDIEDVIPAYGPPNSESSYWLYTIRVPDRDGFQKHMSNHGIMTSPVHARMDTHSCVRRFRSMLPNMDKLANEMTNIPVGWWVKQEDRERVVEVMKKGW